MELCRQSRLERIKSIFDLSELEYQAFLAYFNGDTVGEASERLGLTRVSYGQYLDLLARKLELI